MYDPIQDGIEKDTQSVIYREAKPPKDFCDLIHSYWELKTETPLVDDFILHALPDACVNILFNQRDTRIAGVTALRTTYTALNLGKDFYYAGIQFFPGVWQGNQNETTNSFVGTPYLGDLPLISTNIKSARVDFSFYQIVLRKELENMGDPTDSNVIMKSFPTDMDNYGAGGALVKREGSSPVTGGTIAYFGVEDCSIEESRVEKAGGKVINPKMSIGEYGFVSVCMDTEGNMFGLSSMK